ncbi:MAG TPA: helix-turn-helix domain-containing protein [Ktedonobacterales bacterium]
MMPPGTMPPFHELLRHYRLTSGKTLEQLAKSAKITVEALKLIEDGTSLPPRKDTVERLADALELDGAELRMFMAAGSLSLLKMFGPPPKKPAPEPLPAILVFLIADVRGYTRFTLDYGDEAAAQLATRFAELTHQVVTPRGGQLLELRGDEALCCFRSARQALQAATELQEEFLQATRINPDIPLVVGIGLDVGEAVPVDKGFRGAALNLAARLCSLAGPGDVLVSEAVAHIARKVDGLSYYPWGLAELKGFDDPVRVIRVQPTLLEEPPAISQLPEPPSESEDQEQ